MGPSHRTIKEAPLYEGLSLYSKDSFRARIDVTSTQVSLQWKKQIQSLSSRTIYDFTKGLNDVSLERFNIVVPIYVVHIPMKSCSSLRRFIQGKLRKAMAIMSYSSQTLTSYHSRKNYVHRFFSYSPLILLSTSVWFEFFYSIYHFPELMWNHALYEWWDMSIRVFTTRVPLPLCCRLYWVKMRNR